MDPCLVTSLGYLGLGSNKLPEWKDFATGVLGMQVESRSPRDLRLRMDDKAYRYHIAQSDSAGVCFIGFEADGVDALDQLGRVLAQSGADVAQATPAECADRAVDRMLWTRDPDGNRVEFFCGARACSAPFTSSKPIGGFRTGDLGMGHLVLYTPQYEQMSAFYQGLLNFRLSDFHHEPFSIEFLRVNQRHHSIALISDPGPSRIHHAMVEYLDWDDVGRAYDIALSRPESIAVSLGRHLNDHVTSFYLWTPDAFFVEIGWAGRLVDDATWIPASLDAPSLWGHVRFWQTPEKRAQTRKLVQALGERGVRAPVAVPATDAKTSRP